MSLAGTCGFCGRPAGYEMDVDTPTWFHEDPDYPGESYLTWCPKIAGGT